MIAVTAEEPSGADIAKMVLRQRIRAARRAHLGARDRESDAQALATSVLAIVRRHVGDEVCRVAAYEARATEPPTDRLIARLSATGYDVIVPVTLPELDLDWRRSTTPGAAAQTLGRDAIGSARVVVTPALASDAAGHRLGQGGGSYDRALARRDPGALVVALLYDDELLATGEIPMRGHDMPVDAVVTPGRGVVSCRPEA